MDIVPVPPHSQERRYRHADKNFNSLSKLRISGQLQLRGNRSLGRI